MRNGKVGPVWAGQRAPGRRSRAARPWRELGGEHAGASRCQPSSASARLRERAVGLQPSMRAPSAPPRVARAPQRSPRHARPSCASSDVEPGGSAAPASARQQPVARAHRRLVARRMARMAGIERQHQPVEEAAPRRRRFGEQRIHRRREPAAPRAIRRAHRRTPSAPLIRTCGRSGRGGGRCRCRFPRPFGRARAATANPPAPPAAPSRPAPRAAARGRGEQRHGLEDVGLARAILAGQHDKPGPAAIRAPHRIRKSVSIRRVTAMPPRIVLSRGRGSRLLNPPGRSGCDPRSWRDKAPRRPP